MTDSSTATQPLPSTTSPGEIPFLSVIVPLYCEEKNVKPLYEGIAGALRGFGKSYEIIFVNDGSQDATPDIINSLAARDRNLKVIHLRRNFGQTSAMSAGIDHASGEILIPMDGDLQNDPADIPRLLEKLEEGFDVVSGWRKDRQDAFLRSLLSRMANRLISVISNVHLHDYGCTLKAYRHEVIKDVRLYGEMHRFIPIYAMWQGAKVTEIPVHHYPRRYGRSNYGFERTLKVILDIIVIKFMGAYYHKPIYVFGAFGLISIALGFLAGAWALWRKIFEGLSLIQTPLPLLAVMCIMVGVMSILMGLIAEMLVRTYYESQDKKTYLIRERINF